MPIGISDARTNQAANALYAWLDYDPTSWTDYTSDTESQRDSSDSGESAGASDSSRSLSDPAVTEDRHLPAFLRRQYTADQRDLNDAKDTASLSQYMLPNLGWLCQRPSEALWDDGTWHCPVQACQEYIDPLDLSSAQCAVVICLAGGPSILVRAGDSTSLARGDPWRFLRFVDALGWEHIKTTHLHAAHIDFWYPPPDTVYRVSLPHLQSADSISY